MDKQLAELLSKYKAEERISRKCGDNNVRVGYPRLWIVEEPANDDNKFNVGERIKLSLRILDKRKTISVFDHATDQKKYVPNPMLNREYGIPNSDIFVFVAGEQVFTAKTDNDGNVDYVCPKAGKAHYAAPEYNIAGSFTMQ